jgi:gas vesicle protein
MPAQRAGVLTVNGCDWITVDGQEKTMSAKYRDDRSGGGAFFMGILTGSLLGAALAVLFAPKPGADMRRDLADGAGELGQAAKERWEDVTAAASSAVEKGREAYDQARTSTQEAADQAGKSADRVKSAVKDAASDLTSSAASSASAATAPVGQRPQR